MAASDTKNGNTDSLADLKALRGNLEKTLRQKRLSRPAGRKAPATAGADTSSAAANEQAHRREDDIILASYNIHKCVGTDKVFDPQRIIDVIADLNADILALQEVDQRFGERHGLLDLAEIEKRTGLKPVPLQPLAPQSQGWHGNALFFRTGTVAAVEQMSLPGVEPRGALIAEFAFKNGEQLRIIAAHFGLLRRSRNKQAEAVLAVLKHKQAMPTVLLGDLNEWRIGKNSSLRALTPFFADKSKISPSFPSRFPLLPLDRIFAAPAKIVGALAVHDTALARVASDHLPIKATLHLRGSEAQEQQSAEAETAARL